MTAASARLVRGARILTLDPARPEAEAIAVRDGRVVAIGTPAEAAAAAGAGACVLDLDGAVVAPGLRDAHTHLAAGSEELVRLDLRDASSVEEVVARVAARAARTPEGDWIRGWGWDLDPAPARGALDAAAPRHPAFLVRIDGHTAWLNRTAVQTLGLGATAAATGILFEEDKERAERALPPLSRAERLAALERQLEAAASMGLTAIDDMIPWEALDLYREVRLPLKVRLWLPSDRVPERRDVEVAGPLLAVSGIKVFLDGTLRSRTAALLEPYDDDPESCGMLRLRPRALAAIVREADEAGWDVAVHAIGDRAVRIALDAFAALPPASRRRRHRIEHAEIVDPADLPRFRDLGVIASVQPVHRRLDAAWLEARVGAGRAARAVPVRSLLAAGAEVLFGTDWPVAPLDPLATLDAACDGGPESVARDDAMRAMCGGPLVPGSPADLTVLANGSADSRNVAATVVEGAVMYRSGLSTSG